MAKYEKYAEYQDSGVEWLGEIPKHWDAKRLGSFFEERREKVSDVDYPALSVTKNGIVPQLDTAAKTDAGDNRKLVKIDDFVINSRSDRKGSSGISPYTGSVSLISIVMEPRRIYPAYAHHLLRSYAFQEEFYRYGKGIVADLWSTNSSEMKNILLPDLPISEQKNIANFLDYETAQINTLIAKQEKLIELLKEKRQAVISHAVTKGLNPDVKMKDSGVEWLGQVPEHWTVSKFGYISQVVRGGSPRPAGDPTLFNGDYSPWVTVAEITKDDELYLTSTETFLTKKGSEQCRVFESGTLLLSNSGATLGVPKILSINANANDGVVGFEDLKIDTEYAYFYLSVLTNDLRERVKQGSGQPNLNTDIVKAISITIPPENEVKEIVADIKKKIDHFAKLMATAESAIQLMQERRTALISSAVTGKINVTNWQNPNHNNNEANTELGA